MEYTTFRQLKTGSLILIWVAIGLFLEIAGPTLIDLKLIFNADYETIARSVAARGIGSFLGAIIGGTLVDVTGRWKDLIITVSHVLVPLAVMLIPFIHDLGVLWFLFFVLGVAIGAVNVVGQRIILEMWQEKAPSPMHAMHAGFGIGAVIAPLIANPFLAIVEPVDVIQSNTTSNQTTASVTQSYHVIQETRVQYAYVIIGLLVVVFSVPFFTMICIGRKVSHHQHIQQERHSSKAFKEILNPATYANGSLKYGIFAFTIVLLYFFSVVGGEQMFGNFIRTFSVDQLKFPRNVASYLDTTFWACFTVGRLLGAILSHKFPIGAILLTYATLNVICVTLLDIFSVDSPVALWVFTCVVGLLISPLYPSGMSYINTQIEVGGVVLTLAVIGSGLGDMCYIWMAGHMYDILGPRAVLYAVQISATSVFVIATVFLTVGRFHGNRFSIYLELNNDSQTLSLDSAQNTNENESVSVKMKVYDTNGKTQG